MVEKVNDENVNLSRKLADRDVELTKTHDGFEVKWKELLALVADQFWNCRDQILALNSKMPLNFTGIYLKRKFLELGTWLILELTR